jgi:S-DNA-T family DNA segregation ATPase FtsK/SpoIIIE
MERFRARTRPRTAATTVSAASRSTLASMFENRDLRTDLVALALAVMTLFLGVALLTYDPADPLAESAGTISSLYRADALVYPANEQIHNACGWWGAVAADALLNVFGVGAYFLVAFLAIAAFRLLRRQPVDAPYLRAIGALGALVGLVTLVQQLTPGMTPGPVIGSGGYLGALTSGWLALHFATFGGTIIATSLLVGGTLLATDYTLLKMAQRVLSVGTSGVSRGRSLLGSRRTGVAADVVAGEEAEDAVESDLEEDGSEVDEEVVSIRIGGKKRSDTDQPIAPAAVEETATTDDSEEETGADEASEEAETPAETVEDAAPTTTSAVPAPKTLRVKKPSDKKAEREAVRGALDAAAQDVEPMDYTLPEIDLLIQADDVCYDEQEKEVRRKAKILEKTFLDFGFKVKVVEIETGPVIAQYEVELEAGLRLSKITSLADDLAIALRVPSVRIVAPIPGKNTVGIEVPNEARQVVRLREVIEEANGKVKKMKIPLFLGKDVSGNPMVADLATLPHLLIAGRTGTGKSVCLNAIITSVLMTKRPDEVRMLMIDPKMVELSGYGRLPHLMHPVVTDMRKAEAIFAWAVEKMEERYALLAKAGVRHITSYNALSEDEIFERMGVETEEEKTLVPLNLPFIVIVADEIADLMMTAGKEVEQHIIRLAQKSRAVGIHLILATQKPTVDVITGLIKSNLPARISFQVASRTDSRVVLDEMGADKLLGNGDMLFLWPGTSTLLRGQGTYVSDDEINTVVAFASQHKQDFADELMNIKVKDAEGEEAPVGPGQLKKRDELYEQAIDIVIREGRGSVSLLQRALGIGYGRAARLIDFMAEDKIVGDYNGSQAREVVISIADWEAMQSGNKGEGSAPALPAAPPKKRNKITRDETWDEEPATAAPAKPAAKPRVIKPHEEEAEDATEEELSDDSDADSSEDEDQSAADYEGEEAEGEEVAEEENGLWDEDQYEAESA